MVAHEQQNVATQLVGVGTGILSFGPFGVSFSGSNLAPGHPYNPKPTDTISVGGGGFSVPIVIEQAVLDDQYSASMTATARTHGGSASDPESLRGGNTLSNLLQPAIDNLGPAVVVQQELSNRFRPRLLRLL
jgi:hypothetical protein